MKKIYLLSATLFYFAAFSQNVGINTNTPHASAQLEIQPNPTIGKQGVTLPKVPLISDTDTSSINGGAPANGLIVYNTNANLTGGKGLYYWSATKNKWCFLVNQQNVAQYTNLVRYYTSKTQNPVTLSTTPSGTQLYTKGELISNGWTPIPDLAMTIQVDKSVNYGNINFSGTWIATTGSTTTSLSNSVEFGYGVFLDDKLIYATADTTSFQWPCNYYNFSTTSVVENLPVGTHTIKFAVKLRRIANSSSGSASFPPGTTLSVGGANTACDNLSALEAETKATFHLIQNVR